MKNAAVTGLLLLACSHASGADGYVGRELCASCHKDIAAAQSRTNMARAWPGASSRQIPANYFEKHAEGPAPAIDYTVMKSGRDLQFRVRMPGEPALDFPVESLIGGDRHGLSFLLRVPALKGSPLPRAPLVEARYFHYAEQNRLALELGFPEEKPTSYETALGRVLTPYLEKQCLACHGAPRTHGTRVVSGVDCESCHGPGQAHLAALSNKSSDLGVLNPKKIPIAEQMQPCSGCHAGSSVIEDPMPDDTLISDQVTATKHNECWRQSGGEFACSSCHDPHRDAPHSALVAKSEKTCLRCHSAAVAKHAGLCPVNRATGCVKCHMPDQILGAFVMADHWIRVHPEQKVPEQEIEVPAHNPAWRTTITPKHLYLRIIVLDGQDQASTIRRQLSSGGSFFELARANSIERGSAVNGGYLGDLERSKLDPAWAAVALKLQPGEISDVAEANRKYVILQRMPRNFREDAEAVFKRAMELRKQGKQQECINELLDALKIYPHLLRALTWLGATFAQSGNPAVGVKILTVATQLYPQDGGVHYNLGLAYGAMGDAQEIPEYRRVIEINPDYVLAYLNWGAALYAKGLYEDAVKVFREGIDINPLYASLHYNLGLALEQEKKAAEAEAEMALAAKIDPNVGTR